MVLPLSLVTGVGRGRIHIGPEYPSADNLSPQKARRLLMLALLNSKTREDLDEIFLTYLIRWVLALV